MQFRLSQITKEKYALGSILLAIFLKSCILFSLPSNNSLFEPDSTRYINLASDFFHNYFSSKGTVSEDSFLITPGYPLFLNILGSLEIRQIVFIQFCILGLTQFLLYRILCKLFTVKLALFGLILYLFESSSNLESFHILTETLFSLFFVGFIYLFFNVSESKLIPIFAGLIIGVSILIRPVGQVLILPLIVILIVTRLRFKTGVCLVIAIAILSGWTLRNNAVFDVPQVSGIQSFNLMYYEGAGAASMASSQTLEVSQDLETRKQIAAIGESPSMSDRVDYQQQRGLFLIKNNIPGFLEMHLRGVFKILLGPGSATIDKISSELKLDSLITLAYKVLSIGLSSVMSLLSFISIVLFIRRRFRNVDYRYLYLSFSFMLMLISSSGASAYSRFRVPLIPIEIILTLYALSSLRKELRH